MRQVLQRTASYGFIAALLLHFVSGTTYFIDATSANESAKTNSAWTGQLKLYREVNYDSLLITLTFNTANLCFNLACGDIDDQVSSASWKGLPLKAYFTGAKTSLLMFYRGIDCTGESQGWPTAKEKAPDFGAVGMNDMASSFMFLEYYSGAENGVQNICDYKITTSS